MSRHEFVVWLSSDDLKDLAKFGYGLSDEDVQNLHGIAKLESYGWASVSAEQIVNLAKYFAQNISDETLNNIEDAYRSYGRRADRANEQTIGAIVDDILEACCRTYIES